MMIPASHRHTSQHALARHRLSPQRADSSRDLSMTPMIDVVFQLLLFFLWTSAFEVPEFDLRSEMVADHSPSSAGATPADDFGQVVVELKLSGNVVQWYVNQRPLKDVDALRRSLRELALISRQVPVIVDPASEVALEHVIHAYDAARSCQFENIRFAAEAASMP